MSQELNRLKMEGRIGLSKDVAEIIRVAQYGTSEWLWPRHFCQCKTIHDLERQLSFYRDNEWTFKQYSCKCRVGTPYQDYSQYRLVKVENA